MMLRNLSLLLLVIIPSRAVAQDHGARKAADLVTHSAVTIDRPASLIWPYIVDPSQWKQGLPHRHHAGERGAEGEVRAAYDPADPETVVFFIENTEVVPNQRRTIKLYETGPAGTLLGFAIWTLVEHAGGTRVTYDVYSETLIPRGEAVGVTPEILVEVERESFERNKPRFDRELVSLKKLVESQR